MTTPISPNTQAILLLTAPLVAGRRDNSADLLSDGEYRKLARALRDLEREPADLLGADSRTLIENLSAQVDTARMTALLGRGFLLAQAVERWAARGIWVISRADREYPRKLKSRLKEASPPLLYGCGDVARLEQGGLAVVGSRRVDPSLEAYAEAVGRLVADAGRVLVSGCARGIDRAAMRGALDGGGTSVGITADSLERIAVNREHRSHLMDNRLTLITPYDPAAGFNVGHAMKRNKLVYALADAALVVNAEYESGGTWAGAIEQLETFRSGPVFVRNTGEIGKGLQALLQKGALPWPEPASAAELVAAMTTQARPSEPAEPQLDFPLVREPSPPGYGPSGGETSEG